MTKLKDSDPEKWSLREHTKIKHEILSKYIAAWVKILNSFNKRLVIVDGFAGRGQYFDESDSNRSIHVGSPIILMNLSRQPVVEELVCIYIENDQDNYDNLCRVLDEKKSSSTDFSNVEITKVTYEQLKSNPDKIVKNISSSYVSRSQRIKPNYQKTKIFVIRGEFDKVVQDILSQANRPAPAFYFIDPFGFSAVSAQLITKIMKKSRTEVLLTFMERDIKRFSRAPQIEEVFNNLFNNKDWRKEVEQEHMDMVDYFKSILKRNGITYVIPFKVYETSRRSALYHLIHASNNLKAVDVMKESMKNISPDFTYYGPDNEKLGKDQERLQIGIHPLSNQLCNMFKGQSLRFEDIRSKTIDSNSYVEKDYRGIIKSLEEEGKVKIKRIKSKKTGVDDSDEIIFL